MPLVVDGDVFPVDVGDRQAELADDAAVAADREEQGGLPESLWTQKIPGYRRLLTMPDASGMSFSSSRPTVSRGDGSPEMNPRTSKLKQQSGHETKKLPRDSHDQIPILTSPHRNWPRTAPAARARGPEPACDLTGGTSNLAASTG